MNYSNLYIRIVQKFSGLSRKHAKAIHGYVETHHIIPRCLGGTDDESNLVHLPAKAHFILHYLLVKIHPNSSELWYAFYSMRNGFKQNPERNGHYFVTPRVYELIKKNISRLGRSKETKRKISETLTGKKRGPHSEEHRRNQRESMKGVKKTMSSEAIEARRLNAQKVPKWSEEQKKNQSILLKEKRRNRTEEQIQKEIERRKNHAEKITGKKLGPQSEEAKEKKRQAWIRRKENGVGNGLCGKKRGPYKRKEAG